MKIDKLRDKRVKALKATFGMYKDREDWKGKTSVQIVEEMRESEERRRWGGKTIQEVMSDIFDKKL